MRLDKVNAYKESIQKNPYFYMKEATSLVYVKTVNISRFKIDLTKRKMIDGMVSDNIEEVKKKQYERAKEYFKTVCKSLKELKVGQIFQGRRELVFLGIDKPSEHIKDCDCHIALLDRNNEVQCVFGVTFLFDFEKIGHIDIPADDKYLSFEEYKKITELTWLI